ncbi:hypothetical protein C1T17_16530 [Sphingobium sp. SCG-1]|nr:hypothetical protein C1T17_16530 [Sphingobium sp. SCG-1]
MSRYRDGLRVATNIFEAAAWHYTLKPVCGTCGHHALFDPHGLWWLFERKRWDDRLTLAAKRFRCIPCLEKRGQRVRRASLYLVKDAPTTLLPLPDEREWKRALSRFRS